MKRLFLLLSVLFIGSLCNAVDWQQIDTNLVNFDLYIDNDSVKYINSNEFVYAIRYKAGDKPEKVAYMKSNSLNNYVGVIRSEDYSAESYKPDIVFHNPRVLMKPIKEGSFLSIAHNKLIETNNNIITDTCLQHETSLKDTILDYLFHPKYIFDESYRKSHQKFTAENMHDYVEAMASRLNQNWQPPASKETHHAIIVLTIGRDGSLQEYKFAKSTGNDLLDRSIISAVEKTIPFEKFPTYAKNTETLTFQFMFDSGLLRKSVK